MSSTFVGESKNAIGRTWFGKPIDTIVDEKSHKIQTALQAVQQIIFYGKSVEQLEKLSVAIELSYQFQENIGKTSTLKRSPLGYICASIIGEKKLVGPASKALDKKQPIKSERIIQLNKGSLREYFGKADTVLQTLEGFVKIQIELLNIEDPSFYKLINHQTLVGLDEIVPGIQGSFKLKPTSIADSKPCLNFKQVPTQDLYISNVKIADIKLFKLAITQFLTQQAQTMSVSIDRLKQAPSLENLKLTYIFHNSWAIIQQAAVPISFTDSNELISQIVTTLIPSVPNHPLIACVIELSLETNFEFYSGSKFSKTFYFGQSLCMPFENDGSLKPSSIRLPLRQSAGKTLITKQHIPDIGTENQQGLNIEFTLTNIKPAAVEPGIKQTQPIADNIKKPEIALPKLSEIVTAEPIAHLKMPVKLINDVSKPTEWDIAKQKAESLKQVEKDDSVFSEFILSKDEDRFYVQAIQAFEDEIAIREHVQEIQVQQPIKEPSALRQLIMEVVTRFVTKEEVQQFKALNYEELKFIMKFLIQLTLKNFATGQVLAPKGIKIYVQYSTQQQKTIIEHIIQENPMFSHTLSILDHLNSFIVQKFPLFQYELWRDILAGESAIQQDQNSISNEDKKRLIQLGFGKGLLPQDVQMKIQSNTAIKLKHDQANDILLNYYKVRLHYLGYRAPLTLSNDVLWPLSVQFKCQFFGHPESITSQAQLYSSDTQMDQARLIEAGQSYHFKKAQGPRRRRSSVSSSYSDFQQSLQSGITEAFDTIAQEFQIDLRDESGASEEQIRKYANYLREYTLTIQLIDADSCFIFGVVKLPLSNLSLGLDSFKEEDEMPKASVTKALELDIHDIENGRCLGSLQISVSNQGSLEIKHDETRITRHGDLATSGFKHTPKKKKVTSKPIDLMDQKLSQNTLNFGDATLDVETRKRMRVERLKFDRTVGQPLDHENVNVYKTQQDVVDLIRLSGKSSLAIKAQETGVDFVFTIDGQPGEVKLLNLLFSNPYEKQTIFKVYFEDSESIEYRDEFTLVNNLDGEYTQNQSYFN